MAAASALAMGAASILAALKLLFSNQPATFASRVAVFTDAPPVDNIVDVATDAPHVNDDCTNRTLCACVNIVTDAGGHLNVSVDAGKGFVPSASGFHAAGSTVLFGCYPRIVADHRMDVKVQSVESQAWRGSILYSSDGGDRFTSMTCQGCTSGFSTDSVVVSGGQDSMSSSSACLFGAACVMRRPSYKEGHIGRRCNPDWAAGSTAGKFLDGKLVCDAEEDCAGYSQYESGVIRFWCNKCTHCFSYPGANLTCGSQLQRCSETLPNDQPGSDWDIHPYHTEWKSSPVPPQPDATPQPPPPEPFSNGSLAACVKVTTDFGGFLNLSVDYGFGFALEASGFHEVGSILVNRCYSINDRYQRTQVRVQNDVGQLWRGSVLYSSDGGARYTPMFCNADDPWGGHASCDYGSSGESLVVAGSAGTPLSGSAACLQGQACDLRKPVYTQADGGGYCDPEMAAGGVMPASFLDPQLLCDAEEDCVGFSSFSNGSSLLWCGECRKCFSYPNVTQKCGSAMRPCVASELKGVSKWTIQRLMWKHRL